MNRPWNGIVALSATLFALSACGGGASSGGSTLPVQSAPPSKTSNSTKHVTVAFAGNGALLRSRSIVGSSTAVTITYNGAIVGTGTTDAAGSATLSISDAVPEGASVAISAGSATVSFVIAKSQADTAVLVQVNADGTLSVSVAGGDIPEASPSPGDPDGAVMAEDHSGNPTSVDDNSGNPSLPANLSLTVVPSCSQIILTPVNAGIARLRFEENVNDGDGGSKLRYDGAFTTVQTFPLIAQSARVRIELFDASGKQLLDVRAPIDAFTATPGQATLAPCPVSSAPPSSSPEPTPSTSPSSGPSNAPSPQPSASASPGAP